MLRQKVERVGFAVGAVLAGERRRLPVQASLDGLVHLLARNVGALHSILVQADAPGLGAEHLGRGDLVAFGVDARSFFTLQLLHCAAHALPVFGVEQCF